MQLHRASIWGVESKYDDPGVAELSKAMCIVIMHEQHLHDRSESNRSSHMHDSQLSDMNWESVTITGEHQTDQTNHRSTWKNEHFLQLGWSTGHEAPSGINAPTLFHAVDREVLGSGIIQNALHCIEHVHICRQIMSPRVGEDVWPVGDETVKSLHNAITPGQPGHVKRAYSAALALHRQPVL